MPIYTYRCQNCGIQFDRRQAFDDKPLTRCPECSKEALRKVYLPVGIVFKGSGFYATDHRSPSGQRTTKKPESKPETEKDTSKDSPSSSESSQDE
jgi:putative FmdB family regulatory protein